MSVTIKDKIKRLKAVKGKINGEYSKIIRRNSVAIINLQKNQFTDGYGNDGKDLFNVDLRFNGFYSPGYKKQGRYDFFETGAFIRGLFVKEGPNREIFINSTGKGSGEKSLFFAGYTNLFGLNYESMLILNNKIIMPELRRFLKQNM